MRYLFDSLMERDEQGNIPWLAERHEILDGGTRYIFHLRPGIKWHDGEPLTAADVEFTFNYYREHHPVSIDPVILTKIIY
ncbi:MAG: ABC transporter substrate-binding protein [Bacillota bacterium]